MLTHIEIVPMLGGEIPEDDPSYGRVELMFNIHSSTQFNQIDISHLGIPARSKGKAGIREHNGTYSAGDDLEPNTSALIQITPFIISLANVGDGFLRVNIRLRNGIERCKVTIFQERDLPRAPKDIDDFILYEDIWYCTAVINCLQTIKIEEVTQEKGDTP